VIDWRVASSFDAFTTDDYVRSRWNNINLVLTGGVEFQMFAARGRSELNLTLLPSNSSARIISVLFLDVFLCLFEFDLQDVPTVPVIASRLLI
jgi:hypothetical protein